MEKAPKKQEEPQAAKGRGMVKPQTITDMKTTIQPRQGLRPKMSLRKSATISEPFTPTFGSAESEKPVDQQDERPSFILSQSFKDHEDDHM